MLTDVHGAATVLGLPLAPDTTPEVRVLSPKSGPHVWETIPTNAVTAACYRCGETVYVAPGAVRIRISANVPEGYPPAGDTPGRGIVHVVVCKGVGTP